MQALSVASKSYQSALPEAWVDGMDGRHGRPDACGANRSPAARSVRMDRGVAWQPPVELRNVFVLSTIVMLQNGHSGRFHHPANGHDSEATTRRENRPTARAETSKPER